MLRYYTVDMSLGPELAGLRLAPVSLRNIPGILFFACRLIKTLCGNKSKVLSYQSQDHHIEHLATTFHQYDSYIQVSYTSHINHFGEVGQNHTHLHLKMKRDKKKNSLSKLSEHPKLTGHHTIQYYAPHIKYELPESGLSNGLWWYG